MMLGDKQRLFTLLVSRLIAEAHSMGFGVTLGDAFRDPRLHGDIGIKQGYGHAKSCHKLRLAIDLNLFDAMGTFLTATDDHRPLGEWWERQHELCRWGGRFNDGNHYSFEHDGYR